MSAAQPNTNPARQHQRDVALKIVAPVVLSGAVLGVLCVGLAVGFAAGSLDGRQITVVMGIVATAFIALPMALVCLIPYFILAVSASAAGRLYAHVTTPLRWVRRAAEKVALTTQTHVPKLAQPVVGLNVWIARWEERVRAWQGAALSPGKEISDDRQIRGANQPPAEER